jgi:hypothetical protein
LEDRRSRGGAGTFYSPDRDQEPVETGVDVASGATPQPQHHRFPSYFWDRAGYSIDGLPANRDGSLAEGQDYEMFEIFLRANGYPTAGAAVFVVALLGAAINSSNLLLRISLEAAAIGIVAGWALIVSNNWKGWRSGRVDSFCGDLTKLHDWDVEGPDLHCLRSASGVMFNVSPEAYDELPKTAHYRIYFEPRTRDVVNVDEHSDDAPHEVPSRRTPMSRPTRYAAS